MMLARESVVRTRCLAMVVLCAFVVAPALGQNAPSATKEHSNAVLDEFLTTYKPDSKRLLESVPKAEVTPEVAIAQQQADIAYYLNKVHEHKYRQGVFDWQLWSSKVVFGSVIGLLASALVFSALQFKKDATQPSVIKVAGTGMEVSSPVLGVIILFASLAFFYLYLLHVYPITQVQ